MEMSNGFLVKIYIESPLNMRYDSLTDWYFNEVGDALIIKHIDLGSPVYNHMLVTHELQEAILCLFAGIKSKEIDDWDFRYERDRLPNDPDSEPGDDPRAPYHKYHTTAELIERTIALALHVPWGVYQDVCDEKFAMVQRVRRSVGLKEAPSV